MPLTLYWLALGAFCIGTETFMIAPLLPAMAADLGVSIAAAGQLVTVYALTYAISSPILSTLLGNRDRKVLLIAALAVLMVANLLAAAAQSYAQIMAAQVLLGLSAGVFMPAANGIAAMLVAPERRGRAISVVIGGLTVSLAFGAPAGALIGGIAGWHATFVMVAIVAAVSVLGLVGGLPRNLPRGSATLAERMAVGRRPEVLLALSVTLFWSMGAFCFYTFVAPFLTTVIGMDATAVPLMLFLFGIAGWIGNVVGGRMTDRHGPILTLATALFVLGLTYIAYSFAGRMGPSNVTTAIAVAGFILGGIAGWSFHPSQAARLIHLAPDGAIVALSLNQSALYFGSAAGAALGAFTISHSSLADLGFAAGACELAGLAMLRLALRSAAYAAAAAQPLPGE